MYRFYSFFLFLLLVVSIKNANAQCITSFPYFEDFENNNGNWTANGTNSDWAWGQPVKSKINSAASGLKCWISGGLSNPVYQGGQKSFVVSPCFDFTTLTNPYISFQIFWDTEKYYDGGNFQYSIDGGSNWRNVGAYAASSTCAIDNWFNDGGIFNLSGISFPPEGWSGNTNTGGGSCRVGGGLGKWVTSSNCMKYLAGEPNVRFRFTFCSGTSCNTYDGIAFDSIFIGESPIQTADFTFVCTGGNSISVKATSSSCVNQFNWDFGEPGSQGNISSLQNDLHSYATTGPYTINLKVSYDCSPDVFIQKNVTIIDATVLPYPVTCKDGSDGAVSIKIKGTSLPSITWNVYPIQFADSISGIKVGNYNVVVTDPDGCSVTNLFSIPYGPNAFVKIDLGPDSKLCPGTEIILNPGFFQAYLWNDGSVFPSKNVEMAGIYSVQVSNVDGCVGEDSVNIKDGCGDNVWMPSAFTPNNDTKNDIAHASGVAIDNFNMIIFNRWGQQVFTTDNIENGWDGNFQGKQSSEGIYGYSLHYKLYDGKLYHQEGTLLLIR